MTSSDPEAPYSILSRLSLEHTEKLLVLSKEELTILQRYMSSFDTESMYQYIIETFKATNHAHDRQISLRETTKINLSFWIYNRLTKEDPRPMKTFLEALHEFGSLHLQDIERIIKAVFNIKRSEWHNMNINGEFIFCVPAINLQKCFETIISPIGLFELFVNFKMYHNYFYEYYTDFMQYIYIGRKTLPKEVDSNDVKIKLCSIEFLKLLSHILGVIILTETLFSCSL